MKKFDLERRTFLFAKEVRLLSKEVPRTLANIEDLKQLIRSSGSVGANYIEANDSLGDKDFLMRLRICRKEAKESNFFLSLIYETNQDFESCRLTDLIQEGLELRKIFSKMIINRNKNK